MKRAEQMSKKKKAYNTDNQFKLLIIEEDKENLHEIFGISEDRTEELLNYALDAYKDNNCLHECLEEMTSKCVHVNEVVFSTLMMYRIIESYQNRDRLINMLENSTKNG